jgi:hypothetical protein
MLAKSVMFAALLVGGALIVPASSATLSPQSGANSAAVDDHLLVQKAQWGRCRYWRHECARRWGWGGWEFRRCLRRHDC